MMNWMEATSLKLRPISITFSPNHCPTYTHHNTANNHDPPFKTQHIKPSFNLLPPFIQQKVNTIFPILITSFFFSSCAALALRFQGNYKH